MLFVFESKTKFSASMVNRLQDAINDSAKDRIRIDESLNFIKQKLFKKKEIEQAQRIEKFQSAVDMPYKETYGAAAIISDECFKTDLKYVRAFDNAINHGKINTKCKTITPESLIKELGIPVEGIDIPDPGKMFWMSGQEYKV